MTSYDYPPMSKEALDALLSPGPPPGPMCPWGCAGSCWDTMRFVEALANDWERTGFECAGCRRRWVSFDHNVYGDSWGAIDLTEIHPGWPPDAVPDASFIEPARPGRQ